MVRPLKSRPYKFKPPKKVVPKEKRTVTPIVWYGGKSRDAAAILSQFPPHDTFVDVFGGGGAITFAKTPSIVDIYNDLGNVSNFYKTLRERGEELYEALYLTPFSREEFYNCKEEVKEILSKYGPDENGNANYKAMDDVEKLEWARCWYVVVMESFSHEENATSWKVMKTGDQASGWNTHIDELPRFIERLKSVVIENLDVMKVLKLYDKPDTLFYLDPPYVAETRAEGARKAYAHEMPLDKHQQMLNYLRYNLQGQAVVSMYDHKLYNEMLEGWRRVEIVHPSMIKNSSAKDTGSRTEVLWIKEHRYGLWTDPALFTSNVAGVQGEIF